MSDDGRVGPYLETIRVADTLHPRTYERFEFTMDKPPEGAWRFEWKLNAMKSEYGLLVCIRLHLSSMAFLSHPSRTLYPTPFRLELPFREARVPSIVL